MKRIKKISKVFLIIFTSIALLLVIISSVNNRIGNSNVDVNIEGLGTTIALIKCEGLPKVAFCLNDHFNCNFKANSLSMANIIFPESIMKLENGKRTGVLTKRLSFFIDKNEKIEIIGKIHDYGIDYTITGSDVNNEYSNFINATRETYQNAIQTDIQYKNLRDTSAIQTLAQEKFREYQSLMQEYEGYKKDYIINNPDRLLATYFLSCSPRDTIQKYADVINPNVRKTKYWKRIEQELTNKKVLIIGNLSPEINETDINGEQINLKDFKGKYIVLDFWGTWCGPCKRGIPQMKDIYEKHNKNLEFIGIACNDNESDLKSMIEEYDLKWIQILNKEDNDLSDKFKIESYPTKVILDTNGIIMGIFKGEKPEFYQKIEELMSENKSITTANI
jgi:thiol-disulfide isomerase/thioredoxin